MSRRFWQRKIVVLLWKLLFLTLLKISGIPKHNRCNIRIFRLRSHCVASQNKLFLSCVFYTKNNFMSVLLLKTMHPRLGSIKKWCFVLLDKIKKQVWVDWGTILELPLGILWLHEKQYYCSFHYHSTPLIASTTLLLFLYPWTHIQTLILQSLFKLA